MEINITALIAGIIELIFGAVAIYLIPYLKSKLTEAKYEKLVKWTTIGVRAAEMIFSEAGMGTEKKAYVVKFLKDKGFKVDEAELDAVIEACVLDLQTVIAE